MRLVHLSEHLGSTLQISAPQGTQTGVLGHSDSIGRAAGIDGCGSRSGHLRALAVLGPTST